VRHDFFAPRDAAEFSPTVVVGIESVLADVFGRGRDPP
jgi:hypothetical protein